MKKILVLAIVLTIASLANAITLQISGYDGAPLQQSETVALGINTPDGFVQGDGLFWGLIVSNGPGTLSGGSVIIPPAPDAAMILDPEDYADLAELFGYSGASSVFGSIDTFQADEQYTAPSGLYFNNILFHCDGLGDVTLHLVTTIGFESFDVVDSITISQIPEPMTLSLLGIGGLLLRRFRR
ncbi:MAG: PEP-CTERM sorting domain-containing protein [Phycisphaerae bacterium]